MNDKIRSLLLKHTIVIDPSDVISNISYMLSGWLANRYYIGRTLYVFVPARGSESWIYKEVGHLLPEHICIDEESLGLSDTCCILYMDDWILSGTNATAVMDNIMYSNKHLRDVTYHMITNIYTQFANEMITDLASSYNISYHMHAYQSIIHMDNILRWYGIDDDDINRFNKLYNPDTKEGSYPILSTYKIPNQWGSYPNIYRDLYTITSIYN